MQPSEPTPLHHPPSPYPPHFISPQKINSPFQSNKFHNNPNQQFNPQSCPDSAGEQQAMSFVDTHDQRKQRRMISNRESARRSRVRKQRHMDELWSQVVRLHGENQQLVDKLNDLCHSHDKVVADNGRLREEAARLRQVINNMQGLNSHSPCNNI